MGWDTNPLIAFCIISDFFENLIVFYRATIILCIRIVTWLENFFRLPVLNIRHISYKLLTKKSDYSSIESWRAGVVEFNATLNNISVISWRSDLQVVETGEIHRPVASHWQTLSHIVASSPPLHERDSNTQRDRHWLHS